jgi:hypothetical protein
MAQLPEWYEPPRTMLEDRFNWERFALVAYLVFVAAMVGLLLYVVAVAIF